MNILNKIINNKFFEPSARILLCYLITIYFSMYIGMIFFAIVITIIQTIFTLTDGSGLKLTTNEYYTPKRNKINKIGI